MHRNSKYKNFKIDCKVNITLSRTLNNSKRKRGTHDDEYLRYIQ
jgi:hypothetical protein